MVDLVDRTERAPHLDGVNNVRAALEWCFGVNGDLEIGIGLAAAAVPVFLVMSLMAECHRWSERAMLALDDTSRGGPRRCIFRRHWDFVDHMQGEGEAARLALKRSLAIAEERDDALQPNAAARPAAHVPLPRSGISKPPCITESACRGVAAAIGDPAAIALAHTFMGIHCTYMARP